MSGGRGRGARYPGAEGGTGCPLRRLSLPPGSSAGLPARGRDLGPSALPGALPPLTQMVPGVPRAGGDAAAPCLSQAAAGVVAIRGRCCHGDGARPLRRERPGRAGPAPL